MTRTSHSFKHLFILTCLATLLLSVSFTNSAHGSSARASNVVGHKTGVVDSAAEQDFLNRTNTLRASLGLGSLRLNSELLAKARGWSETQAQSGSIFHSTLSNGVTQNWRRLGENVGMGPQVGLIHDALVASPRHYENLIDPGFTEVGIGVIQKGDVLYVTEVFMEFMPSHPQSTAVPSQTNASQKSTSTKNVAAVPVATSTKPAPAPEAVPLETASADLSATVRKLSSLES